MRVELKHPGIAFWRAKKHGWDVWGTGITVEWDWFRWNLGPVVVALAALLLGADWWLAVGLGLLASATIADYDADPGFHFTSFILFGIRVPFLYFEISVYDRRN